MDYKSPLWRIWMLIMLAEGLLANEDLLSTIEEMQRRQHEYYYQPRYEDAYEEVPIRRYMPEASEDFAEDYKRNPQLENLLLQYLEDKDLNSYGNINKRISSYFRERMNGNKRENYEDLLMEKPEDEQYEDMDDFEYMCTKYQMSFPDLSNEIARFCGNKEIAKRSFSEYYPSLGWDSIGMKKRSPYGRREMLSYILNQAPDNPYQYEKRYYNPYKRSYTKKFPVTKRSSNYYSIPFVSREITHQHKRSPSPTSKPSIKTDPKVEKDLSNIFAAKDSKAKPTKKPTKPTKEPNVAKASAATKKPSSKDEKQQHPHLEVMPAITKEEPSLQIQKKSIRWSDYFGMDRRKKSDDVDNEWLLERYHKAIAMATKKRSGDGDAKKTENEKRDIDEKLKNMEETIVDDTLKYTGAHEDVEDPKEIQEIKNNIITRLVAAYNLEKMRRALEEYRNAIRENRLREPDQSISEEKRVSVPRKSAVDEEREKGDADNSIKCTHTSEDCDEQTYRTPSEVLKDTNWDIESYECPKVQRACNEAASVLGANGRVFEEACNIHQMCLLCGDNSWFAPTRQCNILFLAKADELCEGDVECQNLARHSVRYLVDVNKSLRSEPYSQCDLQCPEKRR